MGLKTYIAKRDFSKTAEPKGGKPLPKRVKGASRETSRRRSRRSSTRVRDFRRDYPGGAVRRRHGYGLGPRQLLCLRGAAGEIIAGRQTAPRAGRRESKGRMDA